MHLQDVNIIIYVPRDSAVMVVVWVKRTLRERMAQAGYWKLKFLYSAVTKDVEAYITHDEDGTLQTTKPAKDQLWWKWILMQFI